MENKRLIGNLIQIGTVTEVKSALGLALARVNILGRVTDFLPVLMFSNDFVKVWMPIRVGQQVVVFSPFGNANSGIILPSIYNKGCKEPSSVDDKKVVIDFANGVRIESDGENIDINASKDINITCTNANIKASSVKIECKDAKVKASSVIVDSSSIDLGVGGDGVVTGGCICALTGLPHSDKSSSVKAIK